MISYPYAHENSLNISFHRTMKIIFSFPQQKLCAALRGCLYMGGQILLKGCILKPNFKMK